MTVKTILTGHGRVVYRLRGVMRNLTAIAGRARHAVDEKHVAAQFLKVPHTIGDNGHLFTATAALTHSIIGVV